MRQDEFGCRTGLLGGWRILKAVETSWVAYALRRLQSVGRTSLQGGRVA